MISMSRAMSREGIIAGIDERADDGGPYNACRQLSRILRHVPPSVPGRAKARPGCQLLLVAGSLGLAAGFEQEPAALFGFVDKFSKRLAVATSSCLSATSCAERMWWICALLSFMSSSNISIAGT